MTTTLQILRSARTTGEHLAAIDHVQQIGYSLDRAKRACRGPVVVHVAAPDPTPDRVRTRRVSVDAHALGREAQEDGDWIYLVDHGGVVPNAYKYRAETSTVVAVASPSGHVVVWYGRRIPANKATLAGAAAAAAPVAEAAWLWDGRTGAERKAQARAALREAHQRVFGAITR